MFSATKFVIGGVIVALFGGFLLSGVLTRPGGEALPAAGGSASLEAPINTDILPGVELTTKEVRPGVFRVLSDGEHDLRKGVWAVAVSRDGVVFVEKYREPGKKENQRVLRLGKPGVSSRVGELRTQDGGEVRLIGFPTDLIFDGTRWVKPAHRHPCKPASDGACWKRDHTNPRREGVARVGATGDKLWFSARDDIGFDGATPGVADVEVADNGTVWVSGGGFGASDGLSSFDGEAWTPVLDVPGPDAQGILDHEVDVDGVVWVTHESKNPDSGSVGEVQLSRWDGEAWASFGPVEALDHWLDIALDGTVWVGPLTSFDGTAFQQIDLPSSERNAKPILLSAAHAPDGSIWVAVGDGEEETDGLYVITPEAAAATE